MRHLFTTTATVNRLSYTGDKSTYSSVGTVDGYLEPIDPNMTGAAVAGIQAQSHTFKCDGSSDILATDRLTIASQDYAVAGIRRYIVGSLDLLDVALEEGIKP